MKWLVALLILVLVPGALASTLSEYPNFFAGKDIKIVVGDQAAASDTIGAVDIATYLSFEARSVEAVLASEINDVTAQDLVVVGGPCANSVAAALLAFPLPCYDPIKPNTALIQLFTFEDHQSLLVAGSGAQNTREGALVMSNSEDYTLPSGSVMEVSRTLQRTILVS